jgi:hypothetical protein
MVMGLLLERTILASVSFSSAFILMTDHLIVLIAMF